ncbi:MAG: hypothetical protein ACXV3S_00750 [Kineosporiaceae bacterium]
MSTTTTTLGLGLGETGLGTGCCGACGGGCSGGCPTCGTVTERPRWFAGQLVGPGDLEALQQWVTGRSRRHNRLVHGWGVACGLAVTATTSPQTGEIVPWSVTVESGYALSACGDDVCLPSAVKIDIRQPRPDGGDLCGPPVDPWCAPVRERRDPERTYYLVIRYAERLTRPVRSAGCGCGCDDDPCEPSRVSETYALAILDELPDCYTEPADIREAVSCSPRIQELGTRPCPDCCSPWVVLADLTVDAAGAVTINPLGHRRFIASFGNFAFTCEPAARPVRSSNLSRADLDVLKNSFGTAAESVVETAEPAKIVAASALQLKGASRAKAFRELIGDRTVADLAKSDLEALTAAGRAAGVESRDIEHVYSLAQLVTKVAGM